MLLESPGLIEDAIIRYKAWEPYIAKILCVFLEDKDIFLDIGANIGYHSLYVSSTYPNATCISFEPHPTTYQQLLRNKDINGLHNMMSYEKGVGNLAETVEFYAQTTNNYNKALSSLHPMDILGNFEKINIEVIVLDQFLTAEQKRQVKVIKIDTQGHEFQVLQGALKTIQQSQPIITFEYHPDTDFTLRQIIDLISDYKVYNFHPWSGFIKDVDSPDFSAISQDFLCIPHSKLRPFPVGHMFYFFNAYPKIFAK